MRRSDLTVAAVAIYITSIVAANWLISRFGLVGIGLGMAVPAGAFCAALTFPLRDVIQRYGGPWLAVAAIPTAAVMSWATSSHVVAVASGVTFLISESCDFAIYTRLQRSGFPRAVVISSCTAAIVDSLVFLHLAHIPYGSALAGLIIAKLAIAVAAWPAVTGLRRALPAGAAA